MSFVTFVFNSICFSEYFIGDINLSNIQVNHSESSVRFICFDLSFIVSNSIFKLSYQILRRGRNTYTCTALWTKFSGRKWEGNNKPESLIVSGACWLAYLDLGRHFLHQCDWIVNIIIEESWYLIYTKVIHVYSCIKEICWATSCVYIYLSINKSPSFIYYVREFAVAAI
jgi:hypothetical protein